MIIVDFLLARIEEDEELAGEAQDPRYKAGGYGVQFAQMLLRECEAKRRIVERHVGHGWLVWTYAGHDAPRVDCGDDCTEWLGEFVLKSLAVVYADHPDYDPEWAL